MPSSKLLKWRYFTKTEALHRDIFCYECAQFCKEGEAVQVVEAVEVVERRDDN
jgi:Pyruvate/2-oxoacid:ferredoxin oxidoreductase delta subunit